VQIIAGGNLDTSAEGSEAVLVEEYKEKDKKTLDSYVPNVIITCTADDDIDTDVDAVHMIDSFDFPTADEVLYSHRGTGIGHHHHHHHHHLHHRCCHRRRRRRCRHRHILVIMKTCRVPLTASLKGAVPLCS